MMKGTAQSAAFKTTGVANIAILDLSKAISRKRCKIGSKLALITNRKSYRLFGQNKLITRFDGRRCIDD